MNPSNKLIQETKALIRLHLFLRHQVGLKENLSLKELKLLLNCLRNR